MSTDRIAIGVDIGSTSIKAVAIDAQSGKVVKTIGDDLPPPVIVESGLHEMDPIALRERVFAVIRGLADTLPAGSVEAIAFTGQMHGGLCVDRDLQPLTNIVSWQDRRGLIVSNDGQTIESVLQTRLGNDAYRTGSSIHSGFLLTTCYALAREGKLSGAFGVLGIHDWIASTLAGRSLTDPSSAASWGMFDILQHRWIEQAIALASATPELLPEVLEPGEVAGVIGDSWNSSLSLSRKTRIICGFGDTQAAYVGSGCAAEELLINVGTGSQAMWETRDTTRVEGTDVRYLAANRYLRTIPTLAGGKAYEILNRLIVEIVKEYAGRELPLDEAYALSNALATADSEGVQFDPSFAGSRGKGQASGASIRGLTQDSFHIGALVKALLEGMIDELKSPYLSLGESHRGLVLAGNGLRRNPELRKVAAERFGLPARLSPSPEEAATGAAMLAAGIFP